MLEDDYRPHVATANLYDRSNKLIPFYVMIITHTLQSGEPSGGPDYTLVQFI